MSTTIDNRVVEMQFDNRHFEQNVKTSLSTIDRLKQSLNFTGASKGLENINSAAKNVNLAGLSSAAETVTAKFSYMQMTIQHQLNRIVDSAVNAGKRIASALTIDPIKTGFQEYETQIGAVQTILANTQSKGTTLDDVNGALDELNTYADKTIYNFTEMTRNIGTFTAAGVDLDKSVTSIKGIANLAAVSGSTSQQASTAMYQLSQALAAGKVSLMDWNSVVNAGMGGEVFQNALKRTAENLGTNVDAMIDKYGSFRESLTQGEWLTAEVLTETLTQLSGAYTEADLIEQGYTKKQAKEILELAKTAEGAATDVKTFTQLWDTLKESAQSGWTQTWELIVGDFEQAKELWSGVSKAIGGIIESSAESRNTLLEGAMLSNWDKMIKKMNDAGIKTEDFEKSVRKVAKTHDVDLDKMIKKYGSLEKAVRSGAISSDILKEAISSVSKSAADLSIIDETLKKGAKGEGVTEMQKALKSLGYDLGKSGVDGKFGSMTQKAVKAFQEAQGLKVTGIVDEATLEALEKATTETYELTDAVYDLIPGLGELGGREILIESLKNIFSSLGSVLARIRKAFIDVFPPMTSEQLYGLIEGFKAFTEKLKPTQKQCIAIYQTFKGLFSAIDIVLTVIKSLVGGFGKLLGGVLPGFANGVLALTGSFGSWITSLRDSIKEADIFGTAIDNIVGFLQKGIDKIKEFTSFVKNIFTTKASDAPMSETADGIDAIDGKLSTLERLKSIFDSIWNAIKKVGKVVGEFASNLGTALTNVFTSDNISSGLDIVNSGIFGAILLGIKNFIDGLGDSFDGVGGVLENVSGILDGVKGSLEAWQQSLKADTLKKIATAIAILAASLVVLAFIEPEKLNSALGAITMLFIDLLGAMAIFDKIGGSFTGVTKTVGMMNGMATAILILAGALRTLSSLSWEELGKGLAGVVGLTVVVVAATKVLSSGKGKILKGASGLIMFGIAMKILASACKDMSSLSWEELGKGLAGVGAIMAGTAIFAKLTKNSGNLITTGIGLIAVGAAMKIFASAIKDFSGFSWDELKVGLAGMAGALLAVAVAVKLMAGSGVFGIGVGLILVAGALVILADVLKEMGGMTWDEIAHGLTALGGAMATLAIGLLAMTGTIGGSAALLIAAGALAILTPVMKALGSMSWESIGKGLVAIAGAFAVIGIAGALLGPIVPALLGLAGAMALIGVAAFAFGAGIALIAAGITALVGVTAAGATAIVAALTIIITGIAALIPAVVRELGNAVIAFCDVIAEGAPAIGEAVKAIVLTLVDVLIECVPQIADGALQLISGLLASLAQYTPQIVDSLFDFLIGLLDGISARLPELIQSGVNLFMSLFSGIFDALKGVDVGTLTEALAGVGIFAGIVAAVGAITPLIPGAMAGILGMGGLIAELAIVLAAIGALAQIPGLEWLISEGGDFLQSIGNALGSFVGGIVGGIAEGITASLPQIGTDLSNFMTNLQPFIDGAKLVDESMLAGVKTIVDIIMTLTGAGILESMTSWITGGSSITDFGTQLVTFGGSIRDFAATVAGVDPTVVTNAANAAKTLFEAASQIPNSGGIISWFTGDNELDTFSSQLKTFGTGIKDFATEVTGIDTTAVSTAATAAETLITAASKIPNEGGIIAWFTGDNKLDNFASQLKSFGSGVKGFATEVDGINVEAVNTSVKAVDAVTKLADSMPEDGYTNLSTMGTKLTTFATKLKTFASDISTIGVAALTTTIDEIEKLITTLKNINDNASDIAGSFGSSLKKIGADGVKILITAFNNANSDVEKAGKDMMDAFVNGVEKQSSKVKKSVETVVGDAADAANDKYDSFKSAGKYVVTGFADGISANTFKAEAKAKAMALAALEAAKEALGIKSPSREFYAAGDFSGMGFVNALHDYVRIAYKAGGEMATSAKEGLTKAISNIGSLLDAGLDTQPTIRPVVDLSGVTMGANSINDMLGGLRPSIATMANIGAISSMRNRRQNGTNDDVVNAINKLGKQLGNTSGNTYQINGITYDNGSAISEAIETLVRAATMERRR